MPHQLELGIDTFGDVTNDAHGEPVPVFHRDIDR